MVVVNQFSSNGMAARFSDEDLNKQLTADQRAVVPTSYVVPPALPEPHLMLVKALRTPRTWLHLKAAATTLSAMCHVITAAGSKEFFGAKALLVERTGRSERSVGHDLERLCQSGLIRYVGRRRCRRSPTYAISEVALQQFGSKTDFISIPRDCIGAGLPWSAQLVYSQIVYQWLLPIHMPDCFQLSGEITWEDLNIRLANSVYSNLNITKLATDLNMERKTVSRSIVALHEAGFGCYEDGRFFICPIAE